MYPLLRMAYQAFLNRKAKPLAAFETHVSHHMCWPWDLDPWFELNNGRTLTLFDLGRIPMAQRSGLVKATMQNGWGLTVAGSSVRYRRRIRVFERITMRSRLAGWDDRFFYIEQSMWKRNGECANHVLIRTAVAGPKGLVAPGEVAKALGYDPTPPALPDWINAWIAADATRPWPPMQD